MCEQKFHEQNLIEKQILRINLIDLLSQSLYNPCVVGSHLIPPELRLVLNIVSYFSFVSFCWFFSFSLISFLFPGSLSLFPSSENPPFLYCFFESGSHYVVHVVLKSWWFFFFSLLLWSFCLSFSSPRIRDVHCNTLLVSTFSQ